MADPRFFAKLDVGYFDNPKVGDFLEERPRVPILHLRAVLYCRQHLTDGVFPVKQVARLACASYCGSQCEGQCDVCAAVDAGLFVNVNGRHAEVHDYLDHQDSAERVKARRSAARDAATRRWDANGNANRNAEGNANGNAESNAEERRGEESSTRTRNSPVKPIPEDWKPTTRHAEQAAERGVDLSSEAFRFRNHAHSVDRRLANWNAGFTNWLSKAKPERTAARGQQPEGW